MVRLGDKHGRRSFSEPLARDSQVKKCHLCSNAVLHRPHWVQPPKYTSPRALNPDKEPPGGIPLRGTRINFRRQLYLAKVLWSLATKLHYSNYPNIGLHISFSMPNVTISEQNLRDRDRSSGTLDDRLSNPEGCHFCSDGGLGGSKLTYSLRYKFLGAIYTAEKALREHRFP